MSAKKILLIILGVVLVLIFVGYKTVTNTYNTLVTLDETSKTSWAQVENVLQRRFDLIPNLVETVKAYASHEQEVLVGVTEARAKVGSAGTQGQKMGAQNMLTSALGKLMVVVEKYPDLKANANFAKLQDELSGTENRIAVERRRFNESIDAYNKSVRQFPTVLLAGMMNFSVKERFEASEGSETAPKVDFDK